MFEASLAVARGLAYAGFAEPNLSSLFDRTCSLASMLERLQEISRRLAQE